MWIVNTWLVNIIFCMYNTQPILGTNPISLAAPGLHGDSFVLDMATSTAALGKVCYFRQPFVQIFESFIVLAVWINSEYS